MPFAVAAALLLVLSTFSIALIYQSELREGSQPVPLEIMKEMSKVAKEVGFDLEEIAYSKAIDSVRSTKKLNESAIMENFSSLFDTYIRTHYPRGLSGFSVTVNGTNVTMMFIRSSIDEIYPELEGQGTAYNLTTVPVYFALTGNMTVVVEGSGGFIIDYYEVDRNLFLPFPLVANRFQSISNALTGGRCEFENIVRYELSALAQDRVLRGYGLASIHGERGTSEILTTPDVLRAMNLAWLLEQKRYLRSVDPELLSLIEGYTEGDSKGLEDIMKGDLDPADLLLSSYGSIGYDMGLILSQSLYAISDLLVLKWLEFLHILDLAEGIESLLESAEISLNGLIEMCLGRDLLQENVIGWISSRMENAGFVEGDYRYMHFNEPDGFIIVPHQSWTVNNDLNESYDLILGGDYQVDFPSLDLFTSPVWGDFIEEWKLSTFQLGDALSIFVKEVAVGISSHFSFEPCEIEFDPSDGISFLDSLNNLLVNSMDEGWLTPLIKEVEGKVNLLDEMSEKFVSFIDSSWQKILSIESSIQEAIDQVANQMVEEATNVVPHFGDHSKLTMELDLKNSFRCSNSWNLVESLEAMFMRSANWRIEAMRGVFSEQVVGADSGPMSSLLSDLVAGALSKVPGVEDSITEYIANQVSQIRDCYKLRCDEILIPLSTASGFQVMVGEYDLLESFEVEGGIFRNDETNLNGVQIGVLMPWEHPLDDGYPNSHMTEPGNISLASFVTQWTISIQAEVDLSIKSRGAFHLMLEDDDSDCKRKINISTEFTVATNSGWPLQGVEYNPTSTLATELTEFLEGIWHGIVDALKIVSDGINGVFSFFKDTLSTLISYSMRAVELLSEGLQAMVSGLQWLFEGVAEATIRTIVVFVESHLGTVDFNATLFGVKFSVSTNVQDLALGITKDILKVTFSFSVFGTTISISSRLLRLGNGDYDMLINCTLGEDCWSLSLIVDPLMKIYNHFVEIKGYFSGLVLLLYLPEIVQYSSHTLSLKDIPGLGALLSNIPTPIPGIKASIDAGFEIKFNLPFVNHPVINEYEQNPPGLDSGNEWVEIYNPTNEVICLDGWTLETAHGDQRLDDLSAISIMPQERIVFMFQGQALDNGGRDKFPLSECIVLKDENGNRIDSTPWTTDHYNDERSWQRSFDGSDRWVFKEATGGAPNGLSMASSSEIEFIKKALWDSTSRAFSETEELGPSLSSLATIFSRSVELVQESLIELLSSSIVEMRLFVEVSLSEYSSSFGAGFSLSLVITGRCVEETLGLIGDMVSKALDHITNPLGLAPEIRPLERLAENIFVRFSVHGSAGIPGYMADVLNAPEIRLEAIVEINLACIGAAFGCNLGKWRMGFGVVVSGIPSSLLPKLFAMDTEKTVDVWLLKAYVFSA